MSERRSDEDLNVPSFLGEGPHCSFSDTPDTGAVPKAEPRPDAARTGAQIIGGCLAGARDEKGVTVEQVYQATRIRPELIRQIEAGNLSRCGGEIYARGHIRAIAAVVGLDAEALISEYLAVPPVDLPGDKPMTVPVRGKTQVRVIRPATPAPRGERKGAATGGAASEAAPVAAAGITWGAAAAPPAGAKRRSKASGGMKVPTGLGTQKGANWTAAMLAVLLGLFVVAGVQLVGGRHRAAGAAALKTPVPSTVAPPRPAAPKPPPVAPTGVAVKVAAVNAPSWLAVYSSNGRKLYDNMLEAGSVETFSDGHQLAVTLGNAAAVHIQLNGKDLGKAGGDGEVVHLTVKPGGVVTG